MSSDNPTVAVRRGEELNVAAVNAVLQDSISGLKGVPVVSRYPSGASNLTYALDYGDRQLVLRRPPFGTKPKSGHDMQREYRIMSALKPVFPAVPDTLFYTGDESVIGAEFYVMERCDGLLIHDTIPEQLDWGADQARALCTGFFTKLVELHQVDYEAIGLSDFGKPDGYVDRQISGWNRRYERAWTDDVDRYDDVRDWLSANKPVATATNYGAPRASILHGDFRIDNCILNSNDPTRIEAILDWEICALGDPMMDLGNTLCYWIEAGDPPSMQAMAKQPSRAPGMMSRKEVLAFYAQHTGADVSQFQFYYVYGIFRLAVIVQQIYYRSFHGQTDDPRFKSYGRMTGMLGELARDKIRTGEL